MNDPLEQNPNLAPLCGPAEQDQADEERPEQRRAAAPVHTSASAAPVMFVAR